MNENVKTIASSDRREKFLGIFSYRNHHRFRMSAFLMLSDISSFVLAGLLAVGIRVVFGEKFNSDLLLQVLPILFFSLLFFGLTGLYPAVGVSVVEEIKRLVSASTLVLLSFTALSFWLRNADVFSRLTLSLTWFFSIFFLPIFRDVTRIIAIRSKLWGEPIAIIGFKKQGQWANFLDIQMQIRARTIGQKNLSIVPDRFPTSSGKQKLNVLLLGFAPKRVKDPVLTQCVFDSHS